MTIEICALAFDVIVSVLIPVIVWGIVLIKNREQWKSSAYMFVCGMITYVVMQWGIKEHALTWLFNNTNFMNFMKNHYIPYLLLIAFAGAVLLILAQLFVFKVCNKKELTFTIAVSFALGYNMLESTMVIGIRCINTIMELIKGTDMELDTSVMELFLSGYERMLLLIIQVAVVLSLCYFIEWKKTVQGGLISLFCYTMISFIPGFFIAFSLPEYYEVFDRSVTLIMVYIVLTATAITSIVVSRFLRTKIRD